MSRIELWRRLQVSDTRILAFDAELEQLHAITSFDPLTAIIIEPWE